MRNYIIEWFPKRKIKGYEICFKNSKPIFLGGLLFVLFSITIGLLSLFGIGTMSWFNISFNLILLVYYRWGLFRFKKNDIGNGVPEKW